MVLTKILTGIINIKEYMKFCMFSKYITELSGLVALCIKSKRREMRLHSMSFIGLFKVFVIQYLNRLLFSGNKVGQNLC